MFKALGILVAIYTLYAISQGAVYAKSGVSGNTISKTDSPKYFWVVIVIYAFLSIVLMTIF